MLETKEVSLDQYTFKIVQLPGMKALQTWHRLTKAFAPAAAHLMGAFKSDKLSEIQVDQLGAAVRDLFAGLPEADLLAMTKTLLESATVRDGEREQLLMNPAVFDKVMAGRTHLVFILLWEAAKLNYALFFAEIAARLQSLGTASKSSSPTT